MCRSGGEAIVCGDRLSKNGEGNDGRVSGGTFGGCRCEHVDEALVKRHAFSEAEQLYSRVNDIVASFSPANGPMIDVINRK